MTSKSSKEESRTLAVRILCIVMAALLILGSISAIFGFFG